MKTWALAMVIATTSMACPAAKAACLSYGNETRLHGTLSRHTFPGPPNYESIARGDRAETYYFVTLQAPVCMKAGTDDTEPAVARTGKLQLVFTNQPQTTTQPLALLLNKPVRCTGKPMHSISGHHHTAILLWDTRCESVSGKG